MSHSTIESEICEFVKEQITGKEISTNTTFESAGLDSFSYIELLLFMERRWGVMLPDNELTRENLTSASTLAACLRKYLPSQG